MPRLGCYTNHTATPPLLRTQPTRRTAAQTVRYGTGWQPRDSSPLFRQFAGLMNRRMDGWMDGCLSWRPLSRRTTTSEKPKESHDYQVPRCKLGDAVNSPVLSPDRIRKELHLTIEQPRLCITCMPIARLLQRMSTNQPLHL